MNRLLEIKRVTSSHRGSTLTLDLKIDVDIDEALANHPIEFGQRLMGAITRQITEKLQNIKSLRALEEFEKSG